MTKQDNLQYNLPYIILSLLDQYCFGMDSDDIIGHTQNCSEAIGANAMARDGYIKIIKGEWPRTKYLTFRFTKKGRDLLNDKKIRHNSIRP